MEFRRPLLMGALTCVLFVAGCLFSTRDGYAQEADLPAAVMPWIEVEIPARSPGIIAQLKVREGRRVQRHELLAVLDRESEVVEVERSQGELDQFTEQARNDIPTRLATKVLEIVMIDLKRAEGARESLVRSISQAELDHLRLAVARGRLELESAQHQRHLAQIQAKVKESQVALARIALKKRDILAPYAGTIAEIRRQPGEWVEPGDPIFRLLVLDRVRVETLFPAARVSPGFVVCQVAFFAHGLRAERLRFPGKVIFVSPEQDPVSGNVRVWVEVTSTQGRLRPGSRGHVRLEMRKPDAERAGGARTRNRTP